jgi:DNA-binding response OmpR family regulator
MSKETKTILVVDDETDVITLAEEILKKDGYKIHGASNGAEGIEKAVKLKPDLILLDINMPEMDGWEVLSALKMDDETKGIPVAIFTVRDDARDKLYSFQQGALDYITKPFTYQGLLDRVRKIFQHVEGATEDGKEKN